MTGTVAVRGGVPEADQELGFTNATLQGAGPAVALSVALHLPACRLEQLCGSPDADPAALERWLRMAFSLPLQLGCSLEVQYGPDREAVLQAALDAELAALDSEE